MNIGVDGDAELELSLWAQERHMMPAAVVAEALGLYRTVRDLAPTERLAIVDEDYETLEVLIIDWKYTA